MFCSLPLLFPVLHLVYSTSTCYLPRLLVTLEQLKEVKNHMYKEAEAQAQAEAEAV
jgi:hypothetical protein